MNVFNVVTVVGILFDVSWLATCVTDLLSNQHKSSLLGGKDSRLKIMRDTTIPFRLECSKTQYDVIQCE
jgi:hypothetical protein